LIRNSIEAIRGAKIANGVISLAARHLHAPERIEFAVADNGPGVDDAIADKLFQPLMTSKHEGLGLGLSICASIVEAHGGKLILHSGAAGATEFRFTVPVEAKTAS
jgi:two-component system sensor kinase FixL